MKNYQIQRGDTLWALSRKYGTSVDALMSANPQIKNRNLIFTGATLHVPGSSDSFQRPNKPSRPAGSSSVGSAPSNNGPVGNAYKIGIAQLGKNASSLKLENTPLGRAMWDWVPNNVNCANFVSGCLQASGQIPASEHSAGSVDFMNKLSRDPHFKKVSLHDAQPGDVVTFDTGHGNHTVMFAGWKDGRPLFLGSNNVNADGSQRITVGHMNYRIMAIQHYVG